MITCVIIDDEPLAIEIIRSYCEEIGGIDVLATYTNPLKFVEDLPSLAPTLVFLDIEMPQINGLDLIKVIGASPYFILTTAYPQYALEGFELNVVDYLVKPIPFPRFIKAINRVKELEFLRKQSSPGQKYWNAALKEPGATDHRFIFIKADIGNINIKLAEIIYVQGLKDYLKLYLLQKKPVLTLMNFDSLQSKLGSEDFIRVHRSFLVNVNYIEFIQKGRIVIHWERIPIGETYKKDFFAKIGLP